MRETSRGHTLPGLREAVRLLDGATAAPQADAQDCPSHLIGGHDASLVPRDSLGDPAAAQCPSRLLVGGAEIQSPAVALLAGDAPAGVWVTEKGEGVRAMRRLMLTFFVWYFMVQFSDGSMQKFTYNTQAGCTSARSCATATGIPGVDVSGCIAD